jgi:hypothetical protein
MLPEQLIYDLHQLNRADKLRAVQLLISDLALEEEFGFVPGASYEIWSPFDSAEAAAILTKMLDEDKQNPDNA